MSFKINEIILYQVALSKKKGTIKLQASPRMSMKIEEIKI